MSKKIIKLINLIVAVLIATVMVGYAFAWFIDIREEPQQINGSSGTPYFESGDGSAADPYIISNRYHMFNLAWLQNTGRLTQKYYFKVKNDLDLTDIWLPPIGTDKYPFKGDFNGNGKTVIDLKVTTDEDKLREYGLPANKDRFSNAVGMFGMTSNESEIHNFILDNPTVEVASVQKSTYANLDNADTQVAGLAVGLVCGKAYSIGVRANEVADGGTRLWVDRAGYSTFNSIIGGLGTNVSSSVTGGGAGDGTGGSGSAFGSSFDVQGMVDRLNWIKGNKESSTPSWRLPNVDSSSNFTVPAKGAKMPFSVTNAQEENYQGADAKEEVSSQNVGYFLGNQNKIEETKELSFSTPLIDPGVPSVDWYTEASDGTHESPAESGKVPAWIYKFNGGTSLSGDVYTSQMGFAPLSQEEFDALPQNIKNIFPENLSEKKRFLKISLSTALWMNEGEVTQPSIQLTDGGTVWSYHGQISWMGKTYGEGFRGSDGDAVDENGNKYSYTTQWGTTSYYKLCEYPNGIMLPNNTIWFKPSRAGKVKIIMFSSGDLRGFALIKITRTSADRNDPFKAVINNEDWMYTSDIELSQVMRVRLPKNVLFYYEHEITQDEIDAGNVEYMMVGENNGADFIYMDLGASGAEEADTPMLDDTKNVSAVDFVYDDVSIKQTKAEGDTIDIGNFIIPTGEAYEATATSIVFQKLETTLKIVYIRKAVTSDVADDARISAAVTGITGENPVKATVAKYAEITP